MSGKWGRGLGGGRGKVAILAGAILMAGAGCHAGDPHDTRPAPGPVDEGGSGGAAGGAGGSPCPADPYSQLCEPDGWCWKNPRPQGRDVFAVWVPAPGEIWGGFGGTLLERSAAGEWTTSVIDPELVIAGFWGAARRDFWVVGREGISTGVIFRWDGSRWMEVNRSGGPLGFTDVDGTSTSDVWAVGPGTVLHFDGAAWTAADVAGVLPSGAVDARVAAASPDDVWVATGRRLLHWNGLSWTFEDVGRFVTDVWAGAEGDAYRALSADLFGTAEVQRWTGVDWAPVLEIAAPAGAGPFMVERLAGSGPHDVWALDSHGTTHRFDGTAWSAVPTGAPFLALDLWAETPGAAVVVGRQGEIREFVGGAWRRVTEGVPAFTRSISGTGGDDIWFAGAVIPPAPPPEPALLHWDGSGIVESDLPPAATPLTTVWAAAPGLVWVGGESGFVARRMGATWQTFVVTTNAIQDIWGATADDAWMSDSAGAVFHWDGGSWSATTVPLTFVFDIHGTSPEDVWMVGSGGVAHWDGTAWSPVALEGMPEVSSVRVWATAPDDVWIRTVTFLTTTEIRHFDGSGFDIVPLPFDQSIDDIWSPGPGQLYVGGDRVLHFADGRWELFGPELPHVWGVAGDSLWGAGNNGTIMRRRLPGASCDGTE